MQILFTTVVYALCQKTCAACRANNIHRVIDASFRLCDES